MAESNAHKFGQKLGDLLEVFMFQLLEPIAVRQDLYLDKQGKRKLRTGVKVTWKDYKSNSHDLDFVLERGGTEEVLGNPVAFIETAWRRYTKHSRNKAQEIQGAVLPLAQTYADSAPFLGAVLAGDFTKGALQQLKSNGFCVLYFPYESIVDAFHQCKVDVSSTADTSEADFLDKLRALEALTDQSMVFEYLKNVEKQKIDDFLHQLESTLMRKVVQVSILPLHGKESFTRTIQEAISFLQSYEEGSIAYPLTRFELIVKYSNSDEIRGVFRNRVDAIKFLDFQS